MGYDYYGFNEVDSDSVINNASNLKPESNPSYSVGDFLLVYPQFGTTTGASPAQIIPTAILQSYIDMAIASVKKSRFKSAWPIAMAYFIAHYCTLWLRSSASPDDGKDAIIEAGYTEGIVTSSSVDGVSYSIDISSSSGDLNGYAAWKNTSFGIQLATMCKLYGKGSMMVP